MTKKQSKKPKSSTICRVPMPRLLLNLLKGGRFRNALGGNPRVCGCCVNCIEMATLWVDRGHNAITSVIVYRYTEINQI